MKKLKNLRILVFAFLLYCNPLTFAQEIIIYSDAKITSSVDALLIIKSSTDLVNYSTETNLKGTVAFKGSDEQKINGNQDISFANFELNNSMGVKLFNNINILNNLNLTSGILKLENSMLTMESNANISGHFSELAMISADKKGKLSYKVDENRCLYFPLGDITDEPEFSPVELNFVSGTYSEDACVSMNLTDARHPQNKSTTDFLSRFWKVSQTGITDFSCNVDFEYPYVDINGDEASIYGGVLDESICELLNKASFYHFIGTVDHFSDFTGGEKDVLQKNAVKMADAEVFISRNSITVISGDEANITKIEIYNRMGQQLYSHKMNDTFVKETRFNVSTGLYIVRITSGNNFISKSVFIN